MLRLLLGAFLSLVLSAPIVAWSEETFVDGHFRKDGTYVQPHWRTMPDSSFNNNWSTSPNVNPHTFQQGTRGVTWLQPTLLVEITYSELMEGRLRDPVFRRVAEE
jgi:hypothetical protein